MSKWYCVQTTRRINGAVETTNHYYPDAKSAKDAREAMIRLNNCKKSIKSQSWNDSLNRNKRNFISYECYDFKKNDMKPVILQVGNVSVGSITETEMEYVK